MMTREDILRELELLPVWQLRTRALPTVVEAKTITQPSEIQQAPAAVPAEETILSTFRMIVSEDAQWMFLLKQNQESEAEALLQNMLNAVLVKPSQDVAAANVDQLSQHSPKVIVVMGENEAQTLLDITQTLEEMRGQPHQYNNVSVVVTYSAEHLLMHLGDKAKAWEDLCLAKLTIAAE